MRSWVSIGGWTCAAALVVGIVGCQTGDRAEMTSKPQAGQGTVTASPFGETPAGEKVTLYTLRNRNGVEARIIDYGGIVVSLRTPDRDGQWADIVLGYDTLDAYIKESPYFGSLVGRYGNRIAKGRFTLDGQTYTLATNNGPNHLHGGLKGFDKVVWDSEPVTAPGGVVGVRLKHVSPDGDEGYPGTLRCTVTYWLTDDDELRIEYHAVTDKPTPVNLTHHGYFNLAGHDSGTILDHEMMINADHFTPTDEGLIPTGEIVAVQGTPMDFRKPTPIGARIDAPYEALQHGGGYDHNWVLNKPKAGALTLAALVHEPTTGRSLEVRTTEPGLQFYCGNFLDGTLIGKGGVAYGHRTGFCLETQHYPDSPNHSNFPSTILRPGEEYRQTTVYRFLHD